MHALKYPVFFILLLSYINVYSNDSIYIDENGSLITIKDENNNTENETNNNTSQVDETSENIEQEYSNDSENEYEEENSVKNSVFHYCPNDEFKSKYTSDDFNYIEDPKSRATNNDYSFSLPLGFIEIIFYILLTVLGAFVIYFLYNLFKDIRIQSRAKPVQTVITKRTENDIKDEINSYFQDLINKAVSEMNYRLAIRYYFLWYLQQLVNKKTIIFNRDKTNSDYLKDIQNENTKTIFKELVNYYNMVWYGERNIDNSAYQTIADIFLKHIKTTNT